MTSKKDQGSPFDKMMLSFPHLAREIVKRVPMDFRFNVAAINQDFYEIVCDMEKFKYKMRISGSNNGIQPPVAFHSILNSNRQFDEIKLFNMDFNVFNLKQLIKIAEKHGKTIKRLEMHYSSMDLRKNYLLFSEFLKNLPNLEEWDFSGWKFTESTPREIKKALEEINQHTFVIVPVLSNLKSFSLSYGSQRFAHIFSRFIAPDSLQDLKLSWDSMRNFQEFLLNQSNLTSLDIREYARSGLFNANLYEHLKLEKFISNCSEPSDVPRKNEFVQKLIQDHPTLRTIQFEELEWLSMTVSITCHHAQQLQCLYLKITNKNCTNLLEIAHLKELKEIGINFSENFNRHKIFKNFSKLNMPSVKILNISRIFNESTEFDVDDALKNFGQNWRNIEELKYNDNEVTIEVKNILENFHKLKFLDVSAAISMEKFNKKFLNSISLKINSSAAIDLLHIIEAVPNLILIDIECRIESSDFKLMMDMIQKLLKLKKLKDLKISFECTNLLTDEVLKAIKKLCGQVEEFKIAFSSRQKSFLDKIVNFIKNDDETCRMVQDKRYVGFLNHLELNNLKF